MPELPRLSPAEAEAALFRAGFVWLRSKGSQRIYAKGRRRVVVPFHGSATSDVNLLPPMIAAWSPDGEFSLTGLYLLLRMKSRRRRDY